MPFNLKLYYYANEGAFGMYELQNMVESILARSATKDGICAQLEVQGYSLTLGQSRKDQFGMTYQPVLAERSAVLTGDEEYRPDLIQLIELPIIASATAYCDGNGHMRLITEQELLAMQAN